MAQRPGAGPEGAGPSPQRPQPCQGGRASRWESRRGHSALAQGHTQSLAGRSLKRVVGASGTSQVAAGQRCPRHGPYSLPPHPRDVESLCPTQGHMHHITSRLLILSLLANEATGSQMGKAGTSRVHGPSWGAPAARRPGASCRPAVTPFRSCLGVARPPRSAAPSCWTLPGQSQGPILGVSRLRAWFPLGTNGGGG